MNVNVQVTEAYQDQINPEFLANAAQKALEFGKASDNTEVTVLIESDQAIQELNNQFLGIDAPTDVLSFPADEIDPETGNSYIGDIMISLPRALAQAGTAGHTVDAELQLLVVHGVLHLLGMDHAEPDEKAVMWAAQRKILKDMGVEISRLPED